jgi:DNA-3-methyladenine glycosylase
MKPKRLKRDFFLKPTLKVAQELLGKYIVHKIGKRKIIGKIVETEAYIGPKDLASHARGGIVTPRNIAEYMIGGHIYIYLVYGMYWQLNISTGPSGKPECVLIRALEPITKKKLKDKKIASGPGKVCKYLKLNKKHYGIDVVTSNKIWLEEGEKIPKSKIVATKRIGIDYAGKYWANKKWRFYIKDNPFVSKK